MHDPTTHRGKEPLAQDVRLYFSGRAVYEDMLADIERAEREIGLEMYIFEDDEIGRRFRDALVRQVEAGRCVRVIYDGLGCLDTPESFFESMRQAGVQVYAFNPIGGSRLLRNWRKVDRRNHRKLLVVDDRVAYLGGINISAELADWEDAHVRLEGRIARSARLSFERVWTRRYPRVSLQRTRRHWLHQHRSLILDGFPMPDFSPVKRTHLHLFSRARRRIRIAHAYFIPDRRIIRELGKAVRRGVDVDVLVPAHSDVRFADLARRHVLGRLLRAGVRVRRLAKPMLHTKAALADEHYAIVGSANLNRTSFFRNLEIALWSRDARVVRPLAERFDRLWEVATPYTLADHRRRDRWRQFLSWAASRLQFWLPTDQAW
ncbi:MAG: phosphatidylserine/phosphatidylglycerophosphate/cardiolipin synthase family protein [Phycisphaerae bacterium]|nr:phosphatidylserine/phosphatidylglycerophosphate/cardiolipin synthase family protein [Phycisphaerae bacterium]